MFFFVQFSVYFRRTVFLFGYFEHSKGFEDQPLDSPNSGLKFNGVLEPIISSWKSDDKIFSALSCALHSVTYCVDRRASCRTIGDLESVNPKDFALCEWGASLTIINLWHSFQRNLKVLQQRIIGKPFDRFGAPPLLRPKLWRGPFNSHHNGRTAVSGDSAAIVRGTHNALSFVI